LPEHRELLAYHGAPSSADDDRAWLEQRLLAERAARIKAEEERDQIAREFKAAIAARDDFVAAASHDLRTPLSALNLQLQTLLRSAGRVGGDPRLVTRLTAMLRQVRHMSLLIERLLDVAQIEGGRLELIAEDVDLAELLRAVIERFEPDLEWARCPTTLRVVEGIVGRWDRMRLDQVVSNLVANAMKYGRGKPIEVTLEGTSESARLTVRDGGIGIPLEKQSLIFEKFERAATERSIFGLGLGLWIVRCIVEASGGSIQVDSQPGRGASFTVELPRTPAPRM
jgi:signal transduction histidine kinase